MSCTLRIQGLCKGGVHRYTLFCTDTPSRLPSSFLLRRYASAFHYFSTSINLKPDFPSSYMYLAITLSRLDDFSNSCSAYVEERERESERERERERERAVVCARARVSV